MKSIITLITFSFCIIGNSLFAQDRAVDSLKNALKVAKHDTTRCNILAALSETASDEDWPQFNEQLLKLSKNKIETTNSSKHEFKFYQKHYAAALSNVGYLASMQGNITKALDFYIKGLEIQEEIPDTAGIGSSLNNIGTIYNSQGDLLKALDYLSKSLKIKEKIGDKIGTATLLNNVGSIYQAQGDSANALDYFVRSLKIREEIGDKKGSATSLNNIANIYSSQGNISKALDYLQRSLKIREENKDNFGISQSLNNIGNIYRNQGDISKALEYHNKSLKIREEIQDKNGMTFSLNNIGDIYFNQKNYPKALEFFTKSMKVSREVGFPVNIKNAANFLCKFYKETGNHKLALENHEIFIQMRDSINNIETQKASIKQQTKYEYEKEKAVNDEMHSIEMKHQEEKAIEENRKQNIVIAAISLGLFLVAIFAIILFNRFRVTKKQKIMIELKENETQLQKQIIEEKHKEITDSINYAERIQRSFLATQQHLDQNLSEYFILFKPKDIVSGDFYWSATLNNGNFAFATADSTGHGVPGAIMSLLNITSLEKAIEVHSDPTEILNATRSIIIERLKKDGSDEGGRDGMDCSLCVYDFKKFKLYIASAHNPVWIVREQKVVEIKPDKMPVGKHERKNTSFSLHEFDLQKGDVVYTLTDGFSDQFGGAKGKKFMSKNLREIILKNSSLPLSDQKQALEKAFASWVGNLEQIDDVTIVGVRV